MTKRYAGYRCEICLQRFSGVGSKARATVCENLPTAPFKFELGDKVQVRKNKKYSYHVKGREVKRRVRKAIEPAHVNRYKIVSAKGSFLWVYEFELIKFGG